MYQDEPPFSINSTFADLIKDTVDFSTVYIYMTNIDKFCYTFILFFFYN